MLTHKFVPNATQSDREERAMLVGALGPRWQVNCRDHTAGAPATKFNRREFKRQEARVVG
jgi:hypothetical protein